MGRIGQAAKSAVSWLKTLRIVAPLVLGAWLYFGYKVVQGGYLQDSWTKARGYMREVKLW